MNINEIKKYAEYMQNQKIKCSCGHSLVLPPRVNKVVCHWCGMYVFKTKKEEFEYRIKEAMRREVEKKKT